MNKFDILLNELKKSCNPNDITYFNTEHHSIINIDSLDVTLKIPLKVMERVERISNRKTKDKQYV